MVVASLKPGSQDVEPGQTFELLRPNGRSLIEATSLARRPNQITRSLLRPNGRSLVEALNRSMPPGATRRFLRSNCRNLIEAAASTAPGE